MLWKIIRRTVKVIGILIGVVILFVIIYFVCSTPFDSKYKHLSDADLERYTQYLESTISEPLAFVSEKFKEYDVVLIGEMHRRRQDVELIKALIPYLYEKNGITVFCWEMGASDFQEEVDSLVTAPVFDERKAISFQRRSYYERNFQEYLDVMKVIWEINQKIPSGEEKIRFLQLGSDYCPRKLYSSDPQIRKAEFKRYYYDKKMAEIVEREVLNKGKKALWYSGLHHAFTKYRQPKMFFIRRTGERRRGGNYLYDQYPDRVYLIVLHMPFLHRWGMLGEVFPSLRKYFWKFYYPFGGVIDKVYDTNPKPFAFDAHDSPFGELKDNYSYYSLDHIGGIKLKDFCDGYIVVCSFDEAEPVHPIKQWVTTDAEMEEIKERMTPEEADKIKDIAGFLHELESDIPETVRSIHNVDKRGFN